MKTTKPILLTITLLFIFGCCTIQQKEIEKNLPEKIQNVLVQTRSNQNELLKSIIYFQHQKDSLKLKALYFLIENMPVHQSNEIVWTKENGDPFSFNELDYKDYTSSKADFQKQTTNLNVYPEKLTYYDLDTLSSKYLIQHIKFAFQVWQNPWAKHFPFDLFCEYILPYRVNTEPIQNWQRTYSKRFSSIADSLKLTDPLALGAAINSDLMQWFGNDFEFKKTEKALPLLGPLNLVHRGFGSCSDMVNLATYAFRSVGLPAAVDFTPFWAASTGGHFWNYTFDSLRYGYSFMGAEENYQTHNINKEMAKVYRIMYSRQKEHIAAQVPKEKIKIDLFQSPNIMDVTHIYIQTATLECEIKTKYNDQVGYLCVFNGLGWKPVDAELILQNKITFRNIGVGVVYLPMIYIKKRLEPLCSPILLNKQGKQIAISGIPEKTEKLIIRNKAKYLIIRPDKQYELRYWTNQWNLHATQKAIGGDSIVFENVPINSLLVLVPEYSTGKERIFTVNKDGSINYW